MQDSVELVTLSRPSMREVHWVEESLIFTAVLSNLALNDYFQLAIVCLTYRDKILPSAEGLLPVHASQLWKVEFEKQFAAEYPLLKMSKPGANWYYRLKELTRLKKQHHRLRTDTIMLSLIIAVGDRDNIALDNILSQHCRDIQLNRPIDQYGKTLLTLAADNNDQACIAVLLGFEANLDSPDGFGRTAFTIAAQRGNLGLMQVLVANGAQAAKPNQNGETATLLAAKHGKMECLVYLISLKLDNYSQKNIYGETALIAAARGGHDDCVELLIQQDTTTINFQDFYGETALRLALKHCSGHCVPRLIAIGADVNLSAYDGTAPLHVVAEGGNHQDVELLIAAGAVVDQQKNNGATALHIAIESKHFACVKGLIRREAEISIADNGGKTPLSLVEDARYDHLSIKYYIQLIDFISRVGQRVYSNPVSSNAGNLTEKKISVSRFGCTFFNSNYDAALKKRDIGQYQAATKLFAMISNEQPIDVELFHDFCQDAKLGPMIRHFSKGDLDGADERMMDAAEAAARLTRS